MRRREYKRKRDGLSNRGVFQELRVTLLEKSLLLGGWVRKILLVRLPTLPRLLILLPPHPPEPKNIWRELWYLSGMKNISSHADKTASWHLLGALFNISDEYPRSLNMRVPRGSNPPYRPSSKRVSSITNRSNF